MGDFTRVNTGAGLPGDGRTIRSRLVFEKRAGKLVKGEVLHVLFGLQMILGRDESCDVQVQDDRISRKHAMIRVDNDTVYMMDLGSTNGTYRYNEVISDEIILVTGDQISLSQAIRFDVRIIERNGQVTSVRLATGGNAFLLVPNELLIGLASQDNNDCDIMVYDPEMLPHHAKMEHFYGNTFVASLDQERPVMVNGNQVKELEIKSGSTLTMGQTVMRWEIIA